MNEVIIIGGGYSVKEGIEKGLWGKIKDKEVWSLNYCYKVMPYLPTVELWVDSTFFKENAGELQVLAEKGVKLYAKKHAMYAFIDKITQFETTREKRDFDKFIYIGSNGLVGFFALSLAVREFERIFLLGYDYGAKNRNTTHFYQDKITHRGVGKIEVYLNKNGSVKREVQDFEVYKNYNIYNVSLISNIQTFPKISYEEFFEMIK